MSFLCPRCKSKNFTPIRKCYIEKDLHDIECISCGFEGTIEEFDPEDKKLIKAIIDPYVALFTNRYIKQKKGL